MKNILTFSLIFIFHFSLTWNLTKGQAGYDKVDPETVGNCTSRQLRYLREKDRTGNTSFCKYGYEYFGINRHSAVLEVVCKAIYKRLPTLKSLLDPCPPELFVRLPVTTDGPLRAIGKSNRPTFRICTKREKQDYSYQRVQLKTICKHGQDYFAVQIDPESLLPAAVVCKVQYKEGARLPWKECPSDLLPGLYTSSGQLSHHATISPADCARGFWGLNCSSRCGLCENVACHHKDGICESGACAEPVFSPPQCRHVHIRSLSAPTRGSRAELKGQMGLRDESLDDLTEPFPKRQRTEDNLELLAKVAVFIRNLSRSEPVNLRNASLVDLTLSNWESFKKRREVSSSDQDNHRVGGVRNGVTMVESLMSGTTIRQKSRRQVNSEVLGVRVNFTLQVPRSDLEERNVANVLSRSLKKNARKFDKGGRYQIDTSTVQVSTVELGGIDLFSREFVDPFFNTSMRGWVFGFGMFIVLAAGTTLIVLHRVKARKRRHQIRQNM